MPEATLLSPDGRSATTLDVPVGNSLMMAAVFATVPGIEGACGGCLSCATCHVYVDPAWLSKLDPPDPDELKRLAEVAAERRPESRLSCQIVMRDDLAGLVVRLPDRQ
jgi:2Fe-2S ferredoxin